MPGYSCGDIKTCSLSLSVSVSVCVCFLGEGVRKGAIGFQTALTISGFLPAGDSFGWNKQGMAVPSLQSRVVMLVPSFSHFLPWPSWVPVDTYPCCLVMI